MLKQQRKNTIDQTPNIIQNLQKKSSDVFGTFQLDRIFHLQSSYFYMKTIVSFLTGSVTCTVGNKANIDRRLHSIKTQPKRPIIEMGGYEPVVMSTETLRSCSPGAASDRTKNS